MQATCPQCSHKLVIDDAKVPDRPFSVKCPKCQNVLKLPGKGAAAAPPPPEPAEEAPAEMPPPPPPARPEAAGGEAHGPRALIALSDRSHAAAAKGPLSRLGYQVDTLENGEEGGRLLEQGLYDLVVTARTAAAGKGETLYQRINRFSPEARRRIFLILVGDDFKSGDGTQAFATLGDLVLQSKDLPSADNLIRNTLAERTRLYQVYLDARRRHEAAAS